MSSLLGLGINTAAAAAPAPSVFDVDLDPIPATVQHEVFEEKVISAAERFCCACKKKAPSRDTYTWYKLMKATSALLERARELKIPRKVTAGRMIRGQYSCSETKKRSLNEVFKQDIIPLMIRLPASNVPYEETPLLEKNIYLNHFSTVSRQYFVDGLKDPILARCEDNTHTVKSPTLFDFLNKNALYRGNTAEDRYMVQHEVLILLCTRSDVASQQLCRSLHSKAKYGRMANAGVDAMVDKEDSKEAKKRRVSLSKNNPVLIDPADSVGWEVVKHMSTYGVSTEELEKQIAEDNLSEDATDVLKRICSHYIIAEKADPLAVQLKMFFDNFFLSSTNWNQYMESYAMGSDLVQPPSEAAETAGGAKQVEKSKKPTKKVLDMDEDSEGGGEKKDDVAYDELCHGFSMKEELSVMLSGKDQGEVDAAFAEVIYLYSCENCQSQATGSVDKCPLIWMYSDELQEAAETILELTTEKSSVISEFKKYIDLPIRAMLVANLPFLSNVYTSPKLDIEMERSELVCELFRMRNNNTASLPRTGEFSWLHQCVKVFKYLSAPGANVKDLEINNVEKQLKKVKGLIPFRGIYDGILSKVEETWQQRAHADPHSFKNCSFLTEKFRKCIAKRIETVDRSFLENIQSSV